MAKEQQTYMQYTPMAWTPGVYQPQAFTPQVADMGLLQSSLNRIEERHNNAVQQTAALHSQLGQLKEKLHRDKNTDKWFDDISTDVDNQLQDAIKFGDFGTAYKTATRLAGEIISRPDVVGRLKWNQDFEAEKKTLDDRLAKKEIDQDTYEWALKKYEDKAGTYTNVTDNDGKVIGGSTYTAPRIYDKVDWVDWFTTAFKLNVPDKISSGNGSESYTDENGNSIDKVTSASKPYAHSSKKTETYREKVTEQDIQQALNVIVDEGGEEYQKLKQDFDVALYRYDRLKQEIENYTGDKSDYSYLQNLKEVEDIKAKWFVNGQPSLSKYVNYKIKGNNTLAKYLAYEVKQDSTVTGINVSTSSSGSGGSTTTQTSQGGTDMTNFSAPISIRMGDVTVQCRNVSEALAIIQGGVNNVEVIQED